MTCPVQSGRVLCFLSTKKDDLQPNGQSPVLFMDKTTKTNKIQSIMVTSLYEGDVNK